MRGLRSARFAANLAVDILAEASMRPAPSRSLLGLIALGALAYFCIAGWRPAAAQGLPVVQTRSGSVQGAKDGGVLAFKGIPYAAPPVRELRWREPRPPA